MTPNKLGSNIIIDLLICNIIIKNSLHFGLSPSPFYKLEGNNYILVRGKERRT
jgi:hypothetical protein